MLGPLQTACNGKIQLVLLMMIMKKLGWQRQKVFYHVVHTEISYFCCLDRCSQSKTKLYVPPMLLMWTKQLVNIPKRTYMYTEAMYELWWRRSKNQAFCQVVHIGYSIILLVPQKFWNWHLPNNNWISDFNLRFTLVFNPFSGKLEIIIQLSDWFPL